MCDNDRSSFVLYGRIEDFPGVHQRLVECSDTDDMRIDNPAGTIECDSKKVFSVEMAIDFQIIIGISGVANNGVAFDTAVA